MKLFTGLLLLITTAASHAYECSIQTEFYRSLPVFLGTMGTLEISSENILALTNRGSGIQTETKANVIRYYYPGERTEAHIIRTTEENGDVLITTAPKYFNCNVRQAVLRKNKIVSLSYCSVDGCRHITPAVCQVLTKNFTDDRLRTGKNPLATIFETEGQLKAMTRELHAESSLLMREYKKLETHSQRVMGVSMTEFETEEGTSATFGLLKLGSLLASETEYCRYLSKGFRFWQEDLRPSKFLPKSQ